MAKVVFNNCYGGFWLSEQAILMYADSKGELPKDDLSTLQYERDFDCSALDREDPILVQIVEMLGPEASGPCSSLKIEEVPNGALYRIREYDGMERVEIRDSSDWRVAGMRSIIKDFAKETA